MEKVEAYVAAKNKNVYYYKGYFPSSLPNDSDDLRFAFIQLDADLFEPTLEGLKFFLSATKPRRIYCSS